jgi:hypothetical protein
MGPADEVYRVGPPAPTVREALWALVSYGSQGAVPEGERIAWASMRGKDPRGFVLTPERARFYAARRWSR